MSIPSLVGIPPAPLQIGGGINLRGNQVADCTPIANKFSPASVTVFVNWATYGASSLKPVLIDVDLNLLGASNPLDKVRSIYIDNTFSPSPVYAFFQDTGFSIVCPANSVVLSPVWTNGLKVQLFANSFDDLNIPKTTYQLSNIHVNEYSVITSSDLVLSKTAIVSDHKGAVSSGGGTSTLTFLNCNFGPFSSKAFQYVGVYANNGFNSVSFNGNVVTSANFIKIQGGGSTTCAMVKCPVNLSGLTNVTVIANLAGASAAGGLDVFAVYNLTNNGNVSRSIGNSGGNAVVNMSTATDGIAIAASCGGTTGTTTLNGIANDLDSTTGFPSSSAQQKTVGATLAINSPNADVNTNWIAAALT